MAEVACDGVNRSRLAMAAAEPIGPCEPVGWKPLMMTDGTTDIPQRAITSKPVTMATRARDPDR